MSGCRKFGFLGGLLALALLLGTSACKDEVTLPTPVDGAGLPSLEALGPGIHAVLSAPAWNPLAGGGPLQVRVLLKGIDIEGSIGSYQGELRYDATTMAVKGVSIPDGLLAAWNEVEKGVIRFAGVSVDGLGELPVLILEVESDAPVKAADFQVVMEEIVSTEGFTNLTQKVVKREHPVLTR